ncbi:hypothetical protein FA13DRAFT_1651882, partial [Coprinellus micaceus]
MGQYAIHGILGKLLWHEVTVVVILVQNMRQKSQSQEDHDLREMLTNMRYAKCTEKDLNFLKSRFVSNQPDRGTLFQRPELRNVSIITSWNSFKDSYNMQGTLRFASDTKQKLTEFRSIDLLTGKLDSKDQAGQAKRHTKKRKKAKVLKMTQVLQEKLWKQPPGTSDHIPASLSLCQGMPVMIRYNTATELCVTKGQEAVVVGWDSTPGPFDSEVLETLFVQLINPPTRVRIPGLPPNVVPLNRQKQSVPCRLPDDSVIVVDRDQV